MELSIVRIALVLSSPTIQFAKNVLFYSRLIISMDLQGPSRCPRSTAKVVAMKNNIISEVLYIYFNCIFQSFLT